MKVEKVIQDDWADQPGVMNACLNVWRALSARKTQLDHYTFAELQNLSKEADEAVVSQALLYLSNPRLKILKACLMYEFRGIYSELPADEVDHYSKGEGVIHPDYGEPLPESEILVCFTPSDGLLQRDSA